MEISSGKNQVVPMAEIGPTRGNDVVESSAVDSDNTHIEDVANTFPLVIETEVEKRVVRKLDRNFIPLIMVLYLLSYLDRSNIGNAKIAGMVKDLKLSQGEYQWLLTIFYISYVTFEWFALMWKLIPPHIWAAFVVFGWGVISVCQAATTNWQGMMALRFLMGVFEAGFAPGVPYLLSFFYLRTELGLRYGIFLSAAPLSTCFAGALAYGITSGHSSKIANWRLLFIVEGIPTVLMAIVTWFYIPDSPETAKFLTAEEKVAARARSIRQVGEEEGSRIGHIRWKDILVTMMDIKIWISAIMHFSCNVTFSSLPVFLPTILNEMGFTAVNAQGLSAPPYFIAFIVVIASTYIADRTQQRGITIIVCSLVGATGYIMLAATSATGPRYAGVFLAAAGIFPIIANNVPWVLNNQGSDTKRGTGVAILNLIGQSGPILGTSIYPGKDGPYYRMGMWTCAAFTLLNAVLALALRCILVHENKKLDAKYGVRSTMGPGEGGHAEDGLKGHQLTGLENDGPNFRYIL